MSIKYVNSKTAPLYTAVKGTNREMVLIFGDELETTGIADSSRLPVTYRGRSGYIDESKLGDKPSLELYFIDVGQGDSTFIVTPTRKKILIDGGINKQAFGFLAWKYRLDEGGSIDIDLLVLTHADSDHIEGLIPIMQRPNIIIHKIVHNGIATFKKGAFATILGNLDKDKKYLISRHGSLNDLNGKPLSDSFNKWKEVIAEKSISYNAVDSRTGVIDIGDSDVTVEILGPRLDTVNDEPAFKWFKNEALTINGHSVIVKLNYRDVSVMLAGDLNAQGAANLFQDPSFAPKINSHVFKAPHHGSNDFHRQFLTAVNPQISVISSGDDPDHGHPRAVFIGAVGKASRSVMPLVFSTEIAATFVESDLKTEGLKDIRLKDMRLKDLNPEIPKAYSIAHSLFKKRLNGMINVRTDGKNLYAARRVAAGYWWESYGPIIAE